MRRNSLLFVFTLSIIFAASSARAQQARQNGDGRGAQHVWTNADLAGVSNPSQTGRVWTNKDVDALRPAQSTQTNHVWLDADMDELRAKGLLSLVGPELETATGQTTEAAIASQAAGPGPVYNSRFEDPRWYEDQAAAIQEQIDGTTAALEQARTNLENARSGRGETGAVHMDQYNIGMTPEEGIARLQEQVQILQEQKDDLADIARRYDIPPGVVR